MRVWKTGENHITIEFYGTLKLCLHMNTVRKMIDGIGAVLWSSSQMKGD